MTEHINYQIIRQNGKPAFVVIPYEDFVHEHPEIAQVAGIPHEVVRHMLYDNVSRICAWRKYLGISQKELAKRVEISQPALSQIEAVGAKPRTGTLVKLATALGVELEQLR